MRLPNPQTRHRLTILLGVLALLGAGAPTRAQRPAVGMMGMRLDSATMAQMAMVHVVQTSRDSVTVAALQQHASEVTELVRDGMAAMHQAMMKNGGGMMHRGMSGSAAADTIAMSHGAHDANKPDSAFAAMQMRGKMAMGVDQYTSTHNFDALPDGGRIELQRNVDDSAGVAQIRAHLQGIATAFKSGDFSTPAFVHMRQVPGTDVMAARHDAIRYTFRELPRGGELRIVTDDSAALKAIHEFLAFQRQDHHAGGMDQHKMPPGQ